VSDYAARLKGGDERASSVRSQSAERLLIGLLVAAILLALVAAAILLAPTALRVTRYELSGNASLTREELLSAALIHEKEYFFSLDAARVKSALEAEPRIADAEVTKLFPNGLRIAVRERKAVAAALVSIDGRARAVCLDAEGVAYAEASPEEAAAVPVLSGLRFEGFRVGTRLPPAVALVVASLGEIEAGKGCGPRRRRRNDGAPDLSLEPTHTRARGRVAGRFHAALHHTRPRRPRDERHRRVGPGDRFPDRHGRIPHQGGTTWLII
jgi:hypothetical protein